jgi:hypothetical protein
VVKAEACDRYDLAWDLVAALLFELGPRLARLELVRALRPVTETHCVWIADRAASAVFAISPRRHDERTADDVFAAADQAGRNLVALFDGLECRLVAKAAATCRSFAAFSRDELGLEPETLLAAFYPELLDDFAQLLDEAVDSDEEAADSQRYFDLFRTLRA